MNKRELEKSILEVMRKEFEDNDMPAKICKQNIAGTMLDVLRVLYSDDDDEKYGGMAEFTFSDTVLSADDVLYFSGYILIRKNLSKDIMPLVLKAAARLSFALPYGSVLVNETVGFVAFRLDTRVPSTLDRESIELVINTNCAHLIELTTQYSTVIADLIDGELTYEEFTHIIEQ